MAPAMWVVEGPIADVYLFGETVGVRRGDAWLVESVYTAFIAAQELW